MIDDYSCESKQIEPPYSIEAEQSVLGGLMLENEKWQEVSAKLKESDFYRKDHQLIFRTIAKLAQKQEPFDVITMSDSLKSSGESNPMGWLVYVGMLARDTPSAANISAYATIVKERSVLRQLMAIGSDLYHAAGNHQGRETEELISEYTLKIQGVDSGISTGTVRHIKDVLADAVGDIEIAFENGGEITGAPTGFTDFDEATGGLQPADLIIVAGRPSMGKTTLAMNMAENVAIKTEKPVVVFSMEMPDKDLAKRSVSSLGRIEYKKIRTGQLEEDEWPRLTSAINLLAGTKLFIDDSSALTIAEIRLRARQLAVENGKLGLIVIDHLGKAKLNGKRQTYEQVGEFTNAAKELAKELKCPVVLLCQLNRELEKRTNKRPIMSDLGLSGSIEQDADLIVFVYRDEVYNEDSADKGVAELIIGKQRNGELKTIRCTFLGQYTRFENHTSARYED